MTNPDSNSSKNYINKFSIFFKINYFCLRVFLGEQTDGIKNEISADMMFEFGLWFCCELFELSLSPSIIGEATGEHEDE